MSEQNQYYCVYCHGKAEIMKHRGTRIVIFVCKECKKMCDVALTEKGLQDKSVKKISNYHEIIEIKKREGWE